jgi:hypothetical protein
MGEKSLPAIHEKSNIYPKHIKVLKTPPKKTSSPMQEQN